MKSLNSFDIVKKQRGVSQTKLRSRPGAFVAQTAEQRTFTKQGKPSPFVVKSPEAKAVESSKLQHINNYGRFINHVKSEKKIA